jgi:hypothetical protein
MVRSVKPDGSADQDDRDQQDRGHPGMPYPPVGTTMGRWSWSTAVRHREMLTQPVHGVADPLTGQSVGFRKADRGVLSTGTTESRGGRDLGAPASSR